MPKPPPRLSTGCRRPRAARRAGRRRAPPTREPAVPKICEPMWQCSRRSAGPEARGCGRRPRASDRAKPNFWSSCAVARKSWVSACTPLLTRTSTACAHRRGAPLAASARARSRVDHDRADADLDGALELGDRLVVAVQAEADGSAPAASATASSAGGDVDGEALLGHPAHDLGREERLAGVVDVRGTPRRAAAREGVTHLARAGARRPRRGRTAECRTARAGRTPTPAISSSPSRHARRRPHQRGERVRIGRFGEPRGHERTVGGGGHAEPIVGSGGRDVTPGSPRSLGHRRIPARACDASVARSLSRTCPSAAAPHRR
jgi:hypothetical protein